MTKGQEHKSLRRKGKEDRTIVFVSDGTRLMASSDRFNPGNLPKEPVIGETVTESAVDSRNVDDFSWEEKDFSNFESSQDAIKWKKELSTIRRTMEIWFRDMKRAIEKQEVDPEDLEIMEKRELRKKKFEKLQEAQKKVNQWLHDHGWNTQESTHQESLKRTRTKLE